MGGDVSRSGWGARPARNVERLVGRDQVGIAVHYSAAGADRVADHANCAGRVRGVQRFHMDGRGWSDIAYSFLVCHHGYVFEGRGFGVRCAAQGSDYGNSRFHSVCFLGGDVSGVDDVSDAGRAALWRVVERVRVVYSGAVRVVPHSWFKSTACPGDELRKFCVSADRVVAKGEEGVLTEEQRAWLLDLVKQRTGQLYNQANAQHGALIRKLDEILVVLRDGRDG